MSDRNQRERDWLCSQRDSLRPLLASFGQEHLLAFFDELDVEHQKAILAQIGSLDFELLKDLFERTDAATDWSNAPIEPADVVTLPRTEEESATWRKAKAIGEEALGAGHVAVLLVAGGQGTRLGFEGPKGTFGIGPVSGKSLFQLHAEKVLALGNRFSAPMTMLVMTSHENDAATRQFFRQHKWFGLNADQVIFFEQGRMPAVERRSGRLLLAQKHSLALSPDGHGGVIRAMSHAGILEDLDRRGVRHLFYFQVDNPMVSIADPQMVGHHLLAGAEFSLKVVRKAGPKERVGNVVRHGDRTLVIEYTDIPDELVHRKTSQGDLAIWAGNMGAHLFDVAFVRRIARTDDLPFHRAAKKVAHIDATGQAIDPDRLNAFKYERFIFDAFPLAQKALPIETERELEFEPVKNAEGENSPATARQAMSNLYGRWLELAGVKVPRDRSGNVKIPIEIGPLFAMDSEELAARLPANFELEGPTLLDQRA